VLPGNRAENEMTVAELIEQLKAFPADMPVVQYQHGSHVPLWESMDGF
jgi:hypothetical protein